MKNIIFDWSGVIKDALEGHLWIVNRIFKDFGAEEILLEEFKENWEQPYFLFYKKYLPNITIKEEQIAYREALFHKDCPKSKDFPGIVELIKKMKEKGYFLTVMSSDFSETVFAEIKGYDCLPT
jgi:phosphoglycolate phosphatase-like HAD superfamily hydrolase